MSIELLPFDTARCSLRVRPAVSARKLAANRRNAQRSTGPRTPAGKRRSSRNALKHGICAAYAHLPGECPAAFATHVAELEEELQPRTIMQRILFPQIADLTWRLRRLPEAQTKLFTEELHKAGENEKLSSAELLARRFSDDPSNNGFLLMGRYERGLQNQLLRLLRQFDQLKKEHPTTPYGDNEDAQVPREMAWDDRRAEAQRHWFQEHPDEAEARKRSHSEPPQNAISESPAGKNVDSDARAAAERSHRKDDSSATDGAPMRTDRIETSSAASEQRDSNLSSSVSIGAPSVAKPSVLTPLRPSNSIRPPAMRS